jgi:4-hydroxybenzoate polyprenyltransferase
MQKIKLRHWIATLTLLFGVSSAYASDYGFWFPALVMGVFVLLIGLAIAGSVLVYKDVQDGTKDKLTWKFYTGAAMLVPGLILLGVNLFE